MVFMLTESKKAFIEFMMSADVLRFGSFVTKSGRNTPYFVNTGNYKTGEQIAKLGKFYASLIKETVGEDFSAMFGPAYKGIPLFADALEFINAAQLRLVAHKHFDVVVAAGDEQ